MFGKPMLIQSKIYSVSPNNVPIMLKHLKILIICCYRSVEDAKKYAAPERKVLKAGVRKEISSFISGSMSKNIRDTKRPTVRLTML